MGLTALYTGANGMKTLSLGMQVVGNNLANVSTLGFKQQMALYQDMKSTTVDSASVNGAGRADGQAVGLAQLGMGVSMAEIRTIQQQGPLEMGSAITDIGIGGIGFFGVASEGVTHYTRAGNFRFDKSGYLVDPNNFRLQGHAFTNGVEGGSSDIHLETDANGHITMAPAATEAVRLITNLGSATDNSADSTDPFFALAKKWDGTQSPPLGNTAYSYSAPMRVYDADGTPHELTVYFDAVQGVSNAGTNSYFEFIVTIPPSEDGRGLSGAGQGLLMSGTLTFGAGKTLQNMSAFVPTGDPSVLSNWAPASFGTDGYPQFSTSFTNSAGATTTAQTVSMNFGLQNTSGTWANAASNASAVGTDAANLTRMSTASNAATSTTAYTGSSSTLVMSQDGYAAGYLMNLDIGRDGIISGNFSNGESQDLFRISLYRFNSEFGLKREGSNHFSATAESGAATEGAPDTQNFGYIASKSLEQSNVDMAREFVTMITTQRGFQSNSKIVTTQDQLIQQALQMKR